ncbi:MAG: PKD domain-containing protein, partial [bacterium]
DTIRWNFGDPASGGLNVSYLATPAHLFSSPGTYTVELYVRHNDNRTDTSWRTITIVASPQVFLGSDKTICTGSTSTFDAGFCSGCTYEWKNVGTGLIVGTNQTFTTGTAGNYCVKVTNGNGCSGYDTVQLVTTPVPQVTNNQLTKSICSGESTNISLTSNVTGTMFHWTASLTSGNISGFSADSGLVINQILIDNLPTPGSVKYTVIPKVGSCSGTPVDFTVTVKPGDSAKVSITASGNNICSGTPVTFTAVPTNPGALPAYQWKVNGSNAGGNSSVFTYTPVNGDQVQCILTSSITVCISNNPASSNTIPMTVNPLLPVSVSVSASANNVCAGIAVTFTAAAVNGGLTPVYQWKVNGIPAGTNSQVYTYTPLNNDAITCTLASSQACISGNPATSSAVIMMVNPLLPVGVSISASSNPFCIGTSVTLTASPVNGGPIANYQWKVNGINAGTNSPTYTYNPVSGDVVTCILNSSLQCVSGNPATSNTITLTGIPGLPASVSITANPNPFCPGSSVTFTATPGNGGANPSYQWKVNGVNAGTNSPTFTYNPLNNDSVRCVMTSTLSCVSANPATSNKITLSGTLAPVITF